MCRGAINPQVGGAKREHLQLIMMFKYLAIFGLKRGPLVDDR